MSEIPPLRPLVSPAPTPEPLPAATLTTRTKRVLWGGGLMAVLAVGMGGLALTQHRTPFQPGTELSGPEATPNSLGRGLTLSGVASDAAPALLERSHFSKQQQNSILAALKENRLRLAVLPVADASGLTGQALTLSSGSLTQTVVLSGQFQLVPLPLDQAGLISFQWASPPQKTKNMPAAEGLSVASVNSFRAVEVLPPLTRAHPQLTVPVIVQ